MIDHVRKYMTEQHMTEPGDRILVGVSGGADSVCLLLLLKDLAPELQISLCAVHVEHGIRGEESRADASFVLDLCDKLGIPCRYYEVDALKRAGTRGESLEEAARKLRYEAYESALKEEHAGVLALAHHRDDQAETMLFHMIRGTGLSGLAGMRSCRSLEGKDLKAVVIRPLLTVTRKEIQEELLCREQKWRTDSSNSDPAYSRNRIRNQIMPMLSEINTGAVTHMGRLAGELSEAEAYLERETVRIFQQAAGVEEYVPQKKESSSERCQKKMPFPAMQTGELSLDRLLLQSTDPFLARRVIHKALTVLAGSSKDLTYSHVEQVLHLCEGQTGRQTDLPYGIRARREYDRIVLTKGHEASEMPDIPLSVPDRITLPDGRILTTQIREITEKPGEIPEKTYTKWMDYDKIGSDVLIRGRKDGDYFILNASGDRKKLNRFFIDEKISAGERDQILLLASGSRVYWIIGHRISEDCKVTADTRRMLVLQIGEA